MVEKDAPISVDQALRDLHSADCLNDEHRTNAALELALDAALRIMSELLRQKGLRAPVNSTELIAEFRKRFGDAAWYDARIAGHIHRAERMYSRRSDEHEQTDCLTVMALIAGAQELCTVLNGKRDAGRRRA